MTFYCITFLKNCPFYINNEFCFMYSCHDQMWQ